MRGATLAAAATALAALLVAAAGASTGGGLDPSYGNGGIVATDFGGEYLQSIAVQQDGKILAAGGMGSGQVNSGIVIRLDGAGQLDRSFDADGRVVVARGAYRGAVAVQRDGKILFAGGTYAFESGGAMSIALSRYNADGSVDSGFGSGGVVVTPLPDRYGMPWHVLLPSDGTIVVVGQSWPRASSVMQVVVLRYTRDGRLDTTFGSGGVTISDWGPFAAPTGAALSPDGAIVVGGYRSDPDSKNLVSVAERLTPDGAPDSSFGSAGIAVTDHEAYSGMGGVAVQADGKVLLAGGTSFSVLRFTTSGALDTTFGSKGVVSLGSRPFTDESRDVAVQRNGKILVFGTGAGDGKREFALKRLLPDGRPDRSFAAALPAVPDNPYPEFVREAPDGKIVAGGWTYSSGNGPNHGVIFRFLPGTCSVPKLAGTSLAAARTKLAAANCRVGTIKNVASRLPKGKVAGSVPAAGKEAPDWAVVRLTLSRGRP
ncbi:MAG TPA: delta-60 repeat domain-containing protein [Gaiellaceae bacterium]